MIIQGLEFVRTSVCSPEQYTVNKDGRQVGYVRVRHGWLTCCYPNSMGDEILESEVLGDGMLEPEERQYFLECCAYEINNRLGAI